MQLLQNGIASKKYYISSMLCLMKDFSLGTPFGIFVINNTKKAKSRKNFGDIIRKKAIQKQTGGANF